MVGEHLIKVIIVDDDEHVRDGIEAILTEDETLAVIAHAEDGLSAISQAEILEPDVMVMDIAMPMIDGIAATEFITARLPNVKILCLSSHTDVSRIRAIIDAGASGYVVKSSARRELIPAVRSIADGMVYLSPGVSSRYLDSVQRAQVQYQHPLK